LNIPLLPTLVFWTAVSIRRLARGLMMEKLSTDELLRWAGRMAQNVIYEVSAADSAMDLLIHDKSVSLETRGKLSLLREQVREAAAPAKRFILISRTQEDLQVLNLHQFFSDLYSLLRALLPEDIAFQMELATDLWPTKVNEAQFEDALITLTVNARDAMPNGGTFRIQATNASEATCQSKSGLFLSGEHVLIEIVDCGVGIPPAHLKRIFDPFVITKGPSCGFGLVKAYGTIKNIGGHVSVKSEVGKGTTFSIFLPRYVPNPVTQSS
jgi:two-component system, cell cycle sensor histidine kinase and response regulator CckA